MRAGLVEATLRAGPDPVQGWHMEPTAGRPGAGSNRRPSNSRSTSRVTSGNLSTPPATCAEAARDIRPVPVTGGRFLVDHGGKPGIGR